MATTQTIVVCGCVDCWSNPTLSRADGGGLQKTTRTLASGCPCYRLDEAACRIHRHLEFRGRPNEPRAYSRASQVYPRRRSSRAARLAPANRRLPRRSSSRAVVRWHVKACVRVMARGLAVRRCRPKRFCTTPPPSHDDRAVLDRCSATATTDATTAATMMRTKVPRSILHQFWQVWRVKIWTVFGPKTAAREPLFL